MKEVRSQNYQFFQFYQMCISDDIRRVFDGILEKYGDVDKILQDLLNKLNNTINSADSRLGQLEKYNRDIRKSNNDSNSKLEPLLISLKVVEDGLKLIKFNKTWPEEKEEAEKSANVSTNSVLKICFVLFCFFPLSIDIPFQKTVPRPATTDIPEQEEELAKWRKFLNELNDSDGASDVMNVPHSVSSELDLLEKLIEVCVWFRINSKF